MVHYLQSVIGIKYDETDRPLSLELWAVTTLRMVLPREDWHYILPTSGSSQSTLATKEPHYVETLAVVYPITIVSLDYTSLRA